MKTAGGVIVLGPSDSLPGVLRAICASPAHVVFLDLSAHTEFRRRADLFQLLASAAAEAGKDLQLVPARTAFGGSPPRARLGNGTGERAGLVARAPGPQRVRPAPATRLAPPRRDSPRWSGVFVVFAVLAGALLAAVAVFILPRARVTIETTVEPLIADLAVTVSTAATAVSPGGGVVPARHVVVEETVEGTFPVETVMQRGDRAVGTARIVNRTASAQGIKSGTRLRAASGVVIRTQADVIVPAGARAPVRVRADAGGVEGNLAPQPLTLVALPAASQRVLSAEIVEPLTGGTDRAVREVAASDLERAASALRAQSEARLLERLGKEFGAGEWFDRAELRRVVLREPVSDLPVGAAAGELHLQGLVRGEALVADAGILRHALVVQAAARAGEGKTLLADLPLSELRIMDVRWDELRADLTLHAETTVTVALSVRELRRQLAGRSPEDAERHVRGLPGVTQAQVSLSPVWIRSVPSHHRNIAVRLIPDRAGHEP